VIDELAVLVNPNEPPHAATETAGRLERYIRAHRVPDENDVVERERIDNGANVDAE
jgi:hypothetical protein